LKSSGRSHLVAATFAPPWPQRVFRLIIAESFLLSVAGGLLGVGCGLAVLGLGRFAIGAEGVLLAFRPTWQLVASGAIVTLAVGCWPAWRRPGTLLARRS
jgi:ABC-type antimicrobial peptide transport system permease subunit